MIKIITDRIYRFDVSVFHHIFSMNGEKFIDRFFYWITRSGDGYLYGIIGLFLIFWDKTSGINTAILIATAFAFELPIHGIVKRMIKRIRPFEKLDGISCLIAAPDKYSFPSGHTAAAFLMANILSFQYPILQLPLWGWATLVGISRVYLGVHYPTDIIAGMILGITTSYLGIWLII